MISSDKKYRTLINRLPLVPVRDSTHLQQANALIHELALKGVSRTSGETDYFLVLSKLVSEYEERTFAYLHTDMSQSEILESLLESSGMTQLDLGNLLSISQARISDVVNGKRELSKEQISKICRHFHLSSDLFLFASAA